MPVVEPGRRLTIILDDAALARLQREAHAAPWDGDFLRAFGEDGDRLIAAFLRANPGWLAAHPELYAVLDPPRRLHGEAMADHMAAIIDQARRHGDAAAAGRRATEGFTQLVQDAVLALMRAPDPAWCLQNDIPGLLRVESVRLSVESAVPGAAAQSAAAQSAVAGAAPLDPGTVEALLGQRAALVRDAGPNPALHGEAAPLTVREALVRVPLTTAPALLAIAVRDPAGLEGASTPSLTFLGQAAAAALERA